MADIDSLPEEPSEPQTAAQRIESLRRDGKLGKSIKWGEEHLKSHPDDHDARLAVAQSHLAIGHVRDADKLFEQVITANPNNVEAWSGYIKAALADRRFDVAAKRKKRATEALPPGTVLTVGQEVGAVEVGGERKDTSPRAVREYRARQRRPRNGVVSVYDDTKVEDDIHRALTQFDSDKGGRS